MATLKKTLPFTNLSFVAEFSKIIRFKDLANDDFFVSEKEENKIMHIALPIGPNYLMGNDVPEIFG